MPSSQQSRSRQEDDADDDESYGRALEAEHNTRMNAGAPRNRTANATDSQSSTTNPKKLSLHTSTEDYGDETTSLLQRSQSLNYRSTTTSPFTPSRHLYNSQSLRSRGGSRRSSISRRVSSLGTTSSNVGGNALDSSHKSAFFDHRSWYDQFTSTDWIRDAITDANRVKDLRARRDWRGRLQALFDGAQGWILVAIIGILTAVIAYIIDVTEATIFDYKTGYCKTRWWYSKRQCCTGVSVCESWTRWSTLTSASGEQNQLIDFAAFFAWVVSLSLLACLITLTTKTNVAAHVTLSTLDENLGAGTDDRNDAKQDDHQGIPTRTHITPPHGQTRTYYPAAGSGVAEVKVILSGFVLHGYLGAQTLLCKSIGLILSVASGLSIGKEGPYVHIATCIGNITSRIFQKYSRNDGKRREVLSAAAAAGVAVAFGAPIGGVLFSLEEVSYYFPPKTLFRTFFCCIAAALSLKFLDPYGTHKIVLFQVRYLTDWHLFEIVIFAALGVIGGTAGAFFIKASRWWATNFRRIKPIRAFPWLEVLLVAAITGLISFWNRYTRLPVAELLYELAAPCDAFSATGISLCPTQEHIPDVLRYLLWAFVVKTGLTIISFGIKVPAGIYVPSMVCGGLLGRMIGHSVQYVLLRHPALSTALGCPADGNPETCVVPGVYALVAAGATMCGVTRLSVTLAVILFELTGSLEHVLPFSLGVLIAKWTADALEPESIYDLLMNAYPYLDSKARPVFLNELADVTNAPRRHEYIDITESSWIKARDLRQQLQHLHMSGEIDGGFPIVQDGVLRGIIPAPDLEFALDRLANDQDVLCYMDAHHPRLYWTPGSPVDAHSEGPTEDDIASLRSPGGNDLKDFTSYIDPAPVSLDICSPMDLVFECFAKLGLRYICVLQEGRYAGMVHKKTFVKYVKDVREHERR